MPDKLNELDNDKFRFKNLGQSAVFLIPTRKLDRLIDGRKVEETLHLFLTEQFGTYATYRVSNFNVFIGGRQTLTHDPCRRYEVSLVGKEQIILLGKKLAEIASHIKEEYIYFKAGKGTALVFPANSK